MVPESNVVVSTSLMAFVSRPSEEPLHPPHDDGKDHEPVLVDQAVLRQRVHEVCAAEDEDVLAGLLLERGHSLRDVVLDQGRVVPLEGLFQGRGGYVLGVAVHPRAVLTRLLLHPGPGGGETLVGNPPEQKGAGRGEFVELEPIPRLVRELEGPARVFHHPVQRHELRYDHPSHYDPPLVVGAGSV
jgi:hypothetical protein